MRPTSDPVDVLSGSRTIAVVGASSVPGKAAHEVPLRLIAAGFEVIPVNPRGGELYGRRCYRTLAEVDRRVDLVDVFRPPAEAAGVVRQAVACGARAVWLQLGITSGDARATAMGAGLGYVEDACAAVVAERNDLHPPEPTDPPSPRAEREERDVSADLGPAAE